MIQRRIEKFDYEELKTIRQKLQRDNRLYAAIMTAYVWVVFSAQLLLQKGSSSPDAYSEVNLTIGLIYGTVMAGLLWCAFVLLFDTALPEDKRRASPAFNFTVIVLIAIVISINSQIPDIRELFSGLARSGMNIFLWVFGLLTSAAMIALIFALITRQEQQRSELENQA